MATNSQPITPAMGDGHGFTHGPPDALKTQDFELYNYLQMVHSHIFGLEGQTGDISSFHDEGTHAQVSQGAAITDVSGSARKTILTIDSADPTNGSETSQVTLLTELKADLTTFFTEYNANIDILTQLSTNFNSLLASLRNGGVIAT